jgi:hypothetical protein
MTSIEPGDLLSRPKWPVIHKGVVTPDGKVFHNTPQRGEHISTIEEFSVGKSVKAIKSPASRRGDILQRLEKAVFNPQRYSYTKYNCDHSSSQILTGNAASPQLAVCMLVGGFLAYKLLRS